MKPILKLNSIRVAFFQRASLTDDFTEPNQTTNQIIMKTILLTTSRRGGLARSLRANRAPRAPARSQLIPKLKTILFMLCFVILTARQTFAIERSWRGGNGPSGGNWSNPQNWFPNGVPQNGDDLEFLSGQATTRSEEH